MSKSEEIATRKELRKLKKIFDCQAGEWKVEKVLTPNPYNTFLLCSRETECVHEDGKTMDMEMIVLDVHNEEFYPATKKAEKLLEKVYPDRSRDEVQNARSDLTALWMHALGNKDYGIWDKEKD